MPAWLKRVRSAAHWVSSVEVSMERRAAISTPRAKVSGSGAAKRKLVYEGGLVMEQATNSPIVENVMMEYDLFGFQLPQGRAFN